MSESRTLAQECKPGGLLDHVAVEAALESARFAWRELPIGPTKGNLGAYTIPYLEELYEIAVADPIESRGL